MTSSSFLCAMCLLFCLSRLEGYAVVTHPCKQPLHFQTQGERGRSRHSRMLRAASATITVAHSSAVHSCAGMTFGRSLLKRLSAPVLCALQLNSIVAGGLLSGGLHAITGPDHLAAILPPSVGRPGWYGLRLGAMWGLGHGTSAIFLGACAYLLKGTVSTRFSILQKLSTLAESSVGISLMLIGFLGIKENLQSQQEAKIWAENNAKDNGSDQAAAVDPLSPLKSMKALYANGLLHGFSWDGAPSLAPALAMTSWAGTMSFLLSYCAGTVLAMSLAAGAVGEGSVRLGRVANSPSLPQNLSLASSLLAILIGGYWFVKGLTAVSL